MKRTKRFLAMLLTLILCVGEISSAGFKVFAAGDENDTAEAMTEEVTEEEDNVEEAPSLDRAGKFEKTVENTRLDTKEMSGPKSLDLIWGGSFVYYGKQYTALENKPLKYRVLDRSTTDFSNDINKKTMLLDCDTYIGQRAYKSGDTGVTSEWKDSGLKEYLNGDDFLSGHVHDEVAAVDGGGLNVLTVGDVDDLLSTGLPLLVACATRNRDVVAAERTMTVEIDVAVLGNELVCGGVGLTLRRA